MFYPYLLIFHWIFSEGVDCKEVIIFGDLWQQSSKNPDIHELMHINMNDLNHSSRFWIKSHSYRKLANNPEALNMETTARCTEE